MKSLATIILSLSFIVSHGEIVKLKFQLFNKLDSSLIGLNKVKIIPIKSYWAEEIEHHSKNSKVYDFKNYKFYYDEQSSNNIFEFDTKEYPYNDIFLSVSSDSFYYYRPFEHDYDEKDCIHLKVDDSQNTYKAYLSSFRFINIFDKNIHNANYCINIRPVLSSEIYYITGNPWKSKFYSNAPETLIKTLVLTQEDDRILSFEILRNNKYHYCDFTLTNPNPITQNIDISELDFKEDSQSLTECLKVQKLEKLDKVIEYY